MKILFKNISSLVTICRNGERFLAGEDMNYVSEIKDGAIFFDEKILWVGETVVAEEQIRLGKIKPDKIYDLKGKSVIPGFVKYPLSTKQSQYWARFSSATRGIITLQIRSIYSSGRFRYSGGKS